MPELRKNYLTDEIVIMATERAKRPNNFNKNHICQFCLENKHLTPPDVYISKDNRVRIFDNKYPAFEANDCGVYGFHEIIVDTNLHEERLHQFKSNDIYSIFLSIVNRLEYFEKNEKIKYIQIFKNEREKSGASIEHSHWQIVATSYIPKKQETISKNADLFHKETSKCYICNLLKELKELTIVENEYFIAYCPYSSKFSYEINITPKRHVADFKDLHNKELHQLSEILKICLLKLNNLFNDLSYNICMYNSIFNDDKFDYDKILHFNLQIIPRLGITAGFEFSTDSHINSIYPEEAVKKLNT